MSLSERTSRIRTLIERTRAVLEQWHQSHYECVHKNEVEGLLNGLEHDLELMLNIVEMDLKATTGVERRIVQCKEHQGEDRTHNATQS